MENRIRTLKKQMGQGCIQMWRRRDLINDMLGRCHLGRRHQKWTRIYNPIHYLVTAAVIFSAMLKYEGSSKGTVVLVVESNSPADL